MAITPIQCADCGATVAGWIVHGDTAAICFQCNERRIARWVCADQINGFETRIAALEALARRSDLAVIRAFVSRVNARAEASMLAGRPLEGSHYAAIQAELTALEDDSHDG